MKRLFFLFCFLLASSPVAWSQGKSFKPFGLRLGAGVVTAPDLIEEITGNVIESLLQPGFIASDYTGTGALNLSLLVKTENKVSYGFDFVYDKIESFFTYTDASLNSKTQTNFISLMGRTDYRHISKPKFRMYSSASAGICIRSSRISGNAARADKEDVSVGGAFHVSPVGIHYGQKLAVWLEAGFGFKGLLNGGVALRL